MNELSVFIVESVSPADVYNGRTDGFAANEVLKIQQVKTAYKVVFDVKYLRQAITDATAGDYLAFHLSAHGDDDGIELTDGTRLNWLALARLLKPFASLDRVLVMSSCMGGYVGFTKALEKRNVSFGYIFGSTAPDGVGFTHCCLAWSILYNRFVEQKRNRFDRVNLKDTLNKINAVVPGDFVYRRWSGSAYLHYPNFAMQP